MTVKSTRSLVLAICLLAAASHASRVAAAERADLRLSAYKLGAVVHNVQLRESLKTLDGIRPGDTIEYEAVYVNGTPALAKNVQVTLPVPAGGLQYLGTSATTPLQQASLDGQRFDAVPLMRNETLADGRVVKRAVPLAEYRALRWTLGDLEAGATRTLKARMQLPALASNAASSASVNTSTSTPPAEPKSPAAKQASADGKPSQAQSTQVAQNESLRP